MVLIYSVLSISLPKEFVKSKKSQSGNHKFGFVSLDISNFHECRSNNYLFRNQVNPVCLMVIRFSYFPFSAATSMASQAAHSPIARVAEVLFLKPYIIWFSSNSKKSCPNSSWSAAISRVSQAAHSSIALVAEGLLLTPYITFVFSSDSRNHAPIVIATPVCDPINAFSIVLVQICYRFITMTYDKCSSTRFLPFIIRLRPISKAIPKQITPFGVVTLFNFEFQLR